MDVIVLRGIERIIIALGGMFFAYLGYRLYNSGIEKGKGELKVESTFYKLIFLGTGPGLFFMAFGGLILIVSLCTGRVEKYSENKGDYSKNRTLMEENHERDEIENYKKPDEEKYKDEESVR